MREIKNAVPRRKDSEQSSNEGERKKESNARGRKICWADRGRRGGTRDDGSDKATETEHKRECKKEREREERERERVREHRGRAEP